MTKYPATRMATGVAAQGTWLAIWLPMKWTAQAIWLTLETLVRLVLPRLAERTQAEPGQWWGMTRPTGQVTNGPSPASSDA